VVSIVCEGPVRSMETLSVTTPKGSGDRKRGGAGRGGSPPEGRV
jgi:hypothetical protein